MAPPTAEHYELSDAQKRDLNDSGQVIGIPAGTQPGTDGYLWTSGTGRTGRTQFISKLIPDRYRKLVSNISLIDITGTDTDGSIGIRIDAQYQADPNGDTDYGTFLLTVESGTSPPTLQQIIPPSNTDIQSDDGISNAHGLVLAVADITTTTGTGASAVTTTGTNHAVLLIPVSLKLLSGQTQDFDGTTPTALIPASENPHYNSDLLEEGTNILGAAPMGTGRAPLVPHVYIAPVMVAAKSPPIGGLQFQWNRSVIAKSWYIRNRLSSTGIQTWYVTLRSADVTPDDVGDGRYNNTTPSPQKNEFYIFDDSGIFYGSEWNDKGSGYMKAGDFIYMEKAFTYKVQSSTDGTTWTDATTIPLAQVIAIYYQATGGDARTDWLGVPSNQAGNMNTQRSITPSITEDKVRAIVGPLGNIVIGSSAQ